MRRTMEYLCEGPGCTNAVAGEMSRLGWLTVTHIGPHGAEVYDFCSWACGIRFAGDLDTQWQPVKMPTKPVRPPKPPKPPHLRDAIQPELPGVMS